MAPGVKNTIIRITAILLFAVIITATALYQAGVYDISFIERKKSRKQSGDTTASERETDPRSTNPEDGTDESYEIFDTEERNDSDKINNLSDLKGFTICKGRWDGDTTIARLPLPEVQAGPFSERTAPVTRVVEQLRAGGGSYTTISTTTDEELPLLTLYFGYVFFNSGEGSDIYTASGAKIAENFTGSLPYSKSVNGNPIVTINKKNYELTDEGISKNEISSEEVVSLPLAFDYPEYYAEPDPAFIPYSTTSISFTAVKKKATTAETEAPEETEETEETENTEQESETIPVTEEIVEAEEDEQSEDQSEGTSEEAESTVKEEKETKPLKEYDDFPKDAVNGEHIIVKGKEYTVNKKTVWGFRNEKGDVVIKAKYKKVFSFTSDGICCVYDFDNETIYIDRSGNELVNLKAGGRVLIPSMGKIHVLPRYVKPISADLSAIGMYYYDSGYVMTRFIYTSPSTITIVYSHENRILDTEGKIVNIPTGYSVINYSDGAILIQKDKLFGYLDPDMGWITDTVYEEAHPFLQGLAVVKLNGKYGMINTVGETVIPFEYDYISDISSGVIAAYGTENGWEMFCTASEK